MAARRVRAAALAAIVAITAAGCGESITQEAFLEQANAICRDGKAEVEAAPRQPMPGFALEVIIPSVRRQIAEMRSLGFPEGDEETLEGIFTDTEAILAGTEADPDSYIGPDIPNPFGDVNRRMAEYGLTDCV